MQLTWVNSTPGPRQRPLKSTVIDARTDPSLPWGTLAIVPAGTSQLAIDPSFAPGDYTARATEIDVGNVASTNQPTCTFSIGADPPSGVTAFTFVP